MDGYSIAIFVFIIFQIFVILVGFFKLYAQLMVQSDHQYIYIYRLPVYIKNFKSNYKYPLES